LGENVKLVVSNEGAAILSGAALAAVMGIMLGGAMRPKLIFDERPMGPQMFAAGGGPRSTGPFDPGGGYAGYSGNIPSYVTGTDAAQAAYVQAPPIAEEQRQVAQNETVHTSPVPLSRAPYYEDPPPLVVYPSEAGGSTYHAETSPPAPPPADPAPTITG
jgi:hypothetical protein